MSAEVRTTHSPRAADAENAGYLKISVDGSTNSSTTRQSAGRAFPRDKSPEERARIRDLCSKARDEADRLWSAARGDRDAMFGPAAKLAAVLDRLWELRADRDQNWIGILDQARIAVRGLSGADGGIESASEDQCWKLFQLVDTCLTTATQSVAELARAVGFVAAMGFDPYAGLEPLGDE